MHALGRLFNVLGTGDDAYVSLIQADAVSFICILAAGDTYTVREATDAAGTGAQVLARITEYYTSRADGTAVWAKNTIAANSAITTTATTQGLAVIHIGNVQLSDGYRYLKCTSTGAGLVIPLVHDLKVQRTPANLPALGV